MENKNKNNLSNEEFRRQQQEMIIRLMETGIIDGNLNPIVTGQNTAKPTMLIKGKRK